LSFLYPEVAFVYLQASGVSAGKTEYIEVADYTDNASNTFWSRTLGADPCMGRRIIETP
jgi:hypothetical protein